MSTEREILLRAARDAVVGRRPLLDVVDAVRDYLDCLVTEPEALDDLAVVDATRDSLLDPMDAYARDRTFPVRTRLLAFRYLNALMSFDADVLRLRQRCGLDAVTADGLDRIPVVIARLEEIEDDIRLQFGGAPIHGDP